MVHHALGHRTAATRPTATTTTRRSTRCHVTKASSSGRALSDPSGRDSPQLQVTEPSEQTDGGAATPALRVASGTAAEPGDAADRSGGGAATAAPGCSAQRSGGDAATQQAGAAERRSGGGAPEATTVLEIPTFLPPALAASLRGTFDANFANSRGVAPQRFVWDYWHVPGQYTQLRTPAAEYFAPQNVEALEAALLEFGKERLGCVGITPLWLSYYVGASPRLAVKYAAVAALLCRCGCPTTSVRALALP